ncbi:translesion DNA synthesis-associated protein ImuA [Coralloluteibacterium stylophorae]|uniref:Translesion DNA synthesis-associated protein ImuA n=1 Tax=Coralloluteibacterium stylophorae TaxID=1776034 RepID=A0A8J7VU93_9GAMM|nr:translesion DNA synthesis-associated protein ImuA [Coralloluteibacterium stylophorae]MBS7455858.1 translesion DNA synthesis-associated protein ImuA [Coralloluteibacterium stylophorae]
MGAVVSLSAALGDGRLYRAGRPLARTTEAVASGLDVLDAALPWGGFPRAALTELLLPADGIGELGLLLPALRRIARRERIAFVAPPWIPYAPALAEAGLPLERLTWVDAPPPRAAWASEQCLRAGCFGAVLGWVGSGDDRVMRRLQVAATDGSALGIALRPLRHARNPSPAALRLALAAQGDGLEIRVLKCRGAVAPSQPLHAARAH